MPLVQDDIDTISEVRPILVQPNNRRLHAIPLLLLMKIASNLFENMMTSFDVSMPNCSQNCSNATTAAGSATSLAVALPMLVVSFILPTLGGLLSDARLGSLNMLWVTACLELLGCSALAVLSHFNIVHQMTPVSMSNAAPVHIFMGLGDTMLLYMFMLYASDSQSRILIMSLYSIASGLGEVLGNMPCVLRDVFGGNYEFIGVIFSACSLLCVFLLSRSRSGIPGANSQRYFSLPKCERIRRFYRIAGGSIPLFAAASVMRLFYWKQLDYFVDLDGDLNLLASYIGLIGWQSGSITFCVISAFAAYKRWIPNWDWVTLKLRIRVGLWLMALAKLPLLFIMIDRRAETMDPTVAWAVCFLSAFSDGLFGAESSLAFYELISCVANRSSKATFIGIFYTTWGFARLFKFAFVSVMAAYLSHLEKAYFYAAYGSVISLLLIAIAYLETVSWPLVSGPLIDHEFEISESFWNHLE